MSDTMKALLCSKCGQYPPLPREALCLHCQPVRSEVEEARAWMAEIPARTTAYDALCDVVNARGFADRGWMKEQTSKLLAAYAAHIRTQERERAQKILDGYEVGIMKPFVQQIAAAIREK